MGEDGAEMTQNGPGHEEDNMPPNEAQALTGSPEKMPVVMLKSANGDADLEGAAPRTQPEFSGLTKEELMRYANDPFWVRLRWALFLLFWMVWLLMLVSAIVIIVLGPKCAPQQKLDWWQKDPIYQVYARSFKDADGDGVGDIAGLRSKLGYLSDTGAKSVWLSPVLESPTEDEGGAVSDFRAIDATYGTLEEFDALLKDVKAKEMHLVLDLEPNHSSDQHDWFQRSVRREANYTDYYVWSNGRGGGPPNAWRTADGGRSAWEYNSERGQWYYCRNGPASPDLNYRSESVQQEMLDVLRFWLEKGVDGFRLSEVQHLFEPEDLDVAAADGDQPETLETLASWRQLCDEYTTGDEEDPQRRLLIVEASGTSESVMEYVGNGTNMADMVSNRLLIDQLSSPVDLSSTSLQEAVEEWRSALPNGTWANWMLGGPRVSRVATRVGAEAVDALNMLVLVLPGTPFTYYGEELGMSDAGGRFSQRSPMQWTAGRNAGFSENGTPWAPLGSEYKEVNVESQLAAEQSHLKVYKKLLRLRQTSASLTSGSYTELITSNSTFAFMRLQDGSPGYVFIINTSDQTEDVDVSGDKRLPDEATVAVRSSQATNQATRSGTRVALKTVPLGPKEAIVLSFVPKAVEDE